MKFILIAATVLSTICMVCSAGKTNAVLLDCKNGNRCIQAVSKVIKRNTQDSFIRSNKAYKIGANVAAIFQGSCDKGLKEVRNLPACNVSECPRIRCENIPDHDEDIAE